MTETRHEPDGTVPTRHSLIGRLKDWNDQESWQTFHDTYANLIHRVALKSGLSETEAREVVQETLISVAKNLKDFQTGRDKGSFKAWLLKTAHWRIIDQVRKRAPEQEKGVHRPPDDTGRTRTIDRIPDPQGGNIEAAWEQEWAENRVAAALDRLRPKVSAKQFQIFQLLVTKELPASQVARILGVSTALVYVTKHRLRGLFQKELKRIDRDLP